MPRVPKTVSRDNERRVISMIAAGRTFQDCVDAGIYKSTSGAYEAYERAMNRDIVKDVEIIRATAIRRIDMQLSIWLPRSLGSGGTDPDPRAAEIVIKLEAERRKYIAGLEAPQQIEAKVENVSSDEFAAWLAGAESQYKLEKERASTAVVD